MGITKEMNRYITAALLVLAFTSSAHSWAAPSLCAKGETIFFSCPVRGGRVVSLCGSIGGDSGSAGAAEWLQYRFGRPGVVELSFPQTKQDSLSKFKGEHVLSHLADAEMSADAVSFVSGGIGYRIESTMPQSRKLFQGVSIGDPRKFDLPVPAQARATYPMAVIPCVSKADTRQLFDLVNALQD